MTKARAAVFASGTGSNFQAIIDVQDLACDVVLLVCDQPNAEVLEKAKVNNITSFVFNIKEYDTKAAYEQHIINILVEAQVDWIFLAGYMRLVSSTLLQVYNDRIINIHPSLLPEFPGMDAIGQAVEAGVKKTGVTVHYVDEGMDTGPIIAQEEIEIKSNDTYEIVRKKVQELEHRLYPKVINKLILKN